MSVGGFGVGMSGQTGGNQYFSTVKAGWASATSRYTSKSRLTKLYELYPLDTSVFEANEVLLSINASATGGTFRLGGTGSVTTTAGQYSISGPTYEIPGAVPLDQTLVSASVNGLPSSSIRFFVGTIQGQPNVMRLCWNFDLPGVLRVACTRHRMSDGVQLGIDAGNDLAGEIHTHESQAGKTVEWAPYLCRREGRDLNVPISGWTFTQRYYDYSKTYGGVITEPWPYGTVVVTDYGSGRKRTSYEYPNGNAWFETQEGAGMVGYFSLVLGGSFATQDTCSKYTGGD